ncbi:MAG: hypothetical protein AAB508_03045 [Patescibacteria group bacterium]
MNTLHKPKWIVFDIGGVLFDSLSALKEISEFLGVEQTQIIEMITENLGDNELGKMSFNNVWVNILNRLNKLKEHENV